MDELLLPAETSSSPKPSKNHHISFHTFNDSTTPRRPQSPKGFSCMSATSPTPTPHLLLHCPISDSPAIGESHECTAPLSRRSHSAPSIFSEIQETTSTGLKGKYPSVPSTPSMVKQAIVGVSLYVSIGVIIYMVRSGSFKGHNTFRLVDALYFSIVTLCTIGYGDIVPDTEFTKLFTCAFILVGFGFVDILLNGLVTYVLDKQEAVLLSSMDEGRRNMVFQTYIMDVKKGRMRVRMKVALALGVVIGCIAVGTIMVHVLEGLNWLDSFYLSVTSVTTVGYGDYTFLTMEGRLFAAVWLLVSTLAVTRAFLYLTELRIEKRNRRIARWVLRKKMTVGDLVAADLDNDGSIRYVVKL
ncbi:two pore potassium channel c [Cocos nucifera]|uniref:Two pore potassium channel c n=1 Tax=Cocos nucifera TaxID=13894 RepID=A0A8K0N354_COCNU|nr:two pore potassium channel c [Cocos nucifera]